MEFNDLLIKERINPRGVLVLRHRPREPKFRKVFPWLAAERPDLYNAYQQTQGPKVEKAMQKADYGTENILGRWLNYAASGHGGNKALRRRKPGNFRFSILQRVSPDMEPADITRLEASWKDRLHTRSFGLNEN